MTTTVTDRQARAEAGDITKAALALILSSVTIRNAAGSALALGVARFSQTVDIRLLAGSYASDLLTCFTLAGQAGATYAAMERVRSYLAGLTPVTVLAQGVVQLGVQLALGQMAKIIAATMFASRNDIEAMMQRIGAAFEDAEVRTANITDAANYQALIALRGAVMRDLSVRERPLPRLIDYSTAMPFTALALAQRLYGDASRADEIVQENSIPHPAFCPLNGIALSN